MTSETRLMTIERAATIALTRMLATELARRELGIRVNMICPGVFPSVCLVYITCLDPFMTDNSTQGMTGYTEDATQPSKEFKDKTGIPLGRTGNAIDYAQTVFSLLSVSTVRFSLIDCLHTNFCG